MSDKVQRSLLNVNIFVKGVFLCGDIVVLCVERLLKRIKIERVL